MPNSLIDGKLATGATKAMVFACLVVVEARGEPREKKCRAEYEWAAGEGEILNRQLANVLHKKVTDKTRLAWWVLNNPT